MVSTIAGIVLVKKIGLVPRVFGLRHLGLEKICRPGWPHKAQDAIGEAWRKRQEGGGS